MILGMLLIVKRLEEKIEMETPKKLLSRLRRDSDWYYENYEFFKSFSKKKVFKRLD